MKTFSALIVAGISAALFHGSAFTQEKPAEGAKPAVKDAPVKDAPVKEAPKEGSKDAPKKPVKKDDDKLKGRVPPSFGKVDLSQAQREKIYAIQNDYDAKLDALKDQIKALVEKRDADIEAVLTPAQKEKLDQAKADSKKKSEDKKEEKKKETDAKKEGEKKPEAKDGQKPEAEKPAEKK